MRGQAKIEGGRLQFAARSGESIPLPPELSTIQIFDLSHPYFWAGFGVVGSPW
ncbi:MAG: hypothetical protein NZ482_01095 [Gloeomargarita sp. SKYG98]|nr:hypothetical protein [Gloeomargarita sp. SKYG98]